METEVDLWSVKDAFIEIENNTPSNTSRDILQTLKSQVDEKRKSKYIDAYTSSYYSKTDFGDVDDKYPQVRFYFHFDIFPILFFTKTFHSI